MFYYYFNLNATSIYYYCFHLELLQNTHQDDWRYFEIILHRSEKGLGFSIAGGIDNPHLPNDYLIYVTKVIPEGVAAIDDRLQINDVIELVNDISIINVTHAFAVETLKNAGHKVKLVSTAKYFLYYYFCS